MKKILITIIGILFATTLWGQSTLTNYKAIISDNTGAILQNQATEVRFTIYDGDPTTTGNQVFQELHTTTTDANGIVVLNIGSENETDWNSIDWTLGNHYLKTEFNIESGFVNMGTQAFRYVPYAHYATTVDFNNITNIPADILDGDDNTQLTETQVDNYVANNGYLTAEVDGSTTNELQTISKIGNTVTLSNGGGTFTDENTAYTAGTGISISGTTITNTGDTDASDDFSGNYADLSGAPTNVSAFTNDAGYLTTTTLPDQTDADFYKIGTTTPPSTINDNIFHMGRIALGKNSFGSTPYGQLEIEGYDNGYAIWTTHNSDVNWLAGNVRLESQYDGDFGYIHLDNRINGLGTGFIKGISTSISVDGSSETQTAVYNLLQSSGTGKRIGVKNYLMAGSNQIQGVNTEIVASGNGDHRGIYNILSGSGSGIHFGIKNELTNGSGLLIGTDNNMSSDGDGTQVAVNNELSGDGSGSHYGTYQILNGSGTGIQYGSYNTISNDQNATHTGTSNNLNGSGSGTHYGFQSWLSGTGTGVQTGLYNHITNSKNARHYGVHNKLEGSGSGIHIGSFSEFLGNGTGKQIGYKTENYSNGNDAHYGNVNYLFGAGTGEQIGVLNSIDNPNNNNHYGVKTSINGGGHGAHYGVYNTLWGAGNGTHFGPYTTLTGTGSGSKFGVYVTIPTTTGGNHYAIFGQAEKTGSYAGYFVGNTAIDGNLEVAKGNGNALATISTLSGGADLKIKSTGTNNPSVAFYTDNTYRTSIGYNTNENALFIYQGQNVFFKNGNILTYAHKGGDLGESTRAWDNIYYDDLHNMGAAAFTDRSVSEEIINHPPIAKKIGDFDDKNKRGLFELNPSSLPSELYEGNALLTDEIVTYNYKANYEQQVQLNELKKIVAKQQELIKKLSEKIEELEKKNS